MRRKLHEIIGVPPEVSGGETPEYPVLPDEFNRNAPTVTEEEKPSRLRKTMLLLAFMGLVTVGVFGFRPRQTPATAEAQPTAPAVTAQPDATSAPTQEPTPEPTPEPTAEPTPEPTFTPTPTPVVLTGRIHIVVYADVFSMNLGGRGYDNAVLADETFDADSFTEYALPPLPTQDGYTALGYVLFADSSMHYLEDLYFELAQPYAVGSVALDGVVTADDLGVVPLNDAGVREAEVHTVWLSDSGSYVLECYDGDEPIASYPVAFPMDSETLIYLAAFPKPEREGLIFNGWCNALGNRIDAVTYFDFFEPLNPAPTLEDRNWRKPIPCKVYATWTDPYGNITEPEVPVPDCDAVFYQTHSVLNAAVTLTDRWRTTAVHVRIWDEQVNDSLLEYDLEEDYIKFGFWAQEGIDLQTFYAKHREEYESAGTRISLQLEVTLTYEMPDGTTGTVVRRSEPKPEDYVMVEYHSADAEPNAYTFPDCFVVTVYDAVTEENPPFITDRTHDLLPGEIYVGISASYHRLSADQCRVECIADSYEYEGKTYTSYTYYLVFPRPDDIPPHGTATVTVKQRFLHFNFMRIDEHTVEY